MSDNIRWLDWAVELQSLAQAGLTYGKDDFDRERYQRIRTIAADIISQHSSLPAARVADLFCNESGYQTPKLDTRAAIIEDDKILLVQERDCRWALPGGWVDVNCSVRENITKEVKEEAGLDVVAERILALHDWHQHNLRLAYLQNLHPMPRAGRRLPAEQRNPRQRLVPRRRPAATCQRKKQRRANRALLHRRARPAMATPV